MNIYNFENRLLFKTNSQNVNQEVEKNTDNAADDVELNDDNIDAFADSVSKDLTSEQAGKKRKFDVLGGIENAVGGKEKITEAIKEKAKEATSKTFGSFLKKIAVIGATAYIGSKVFGVIKKFVGKLFGFGEKAKSNVSESGSSTISSIMKLALGGVAFVGVWKLVKENISFAEIGLAYTKDGPVGVAKYIGSKLSDGTIKMTKELGVALAGFAKYLGIPLSVFGLVDKTKSAKDKLKEEMEHIKKSREGGSEKSKVKELPDGVVEKNGKFYKVVDGVKIEVSPLREKMGDVNESVKNFGGKVVEFSKQHGSSLMFIGLFSGFGFSLAKTAAGTVSKAAHVSASALANLAKLPFKAFKNFPISSFVASMALIKFISSLNDKEIMIPKDEKNFDKWFSAKLKDSRVVKFCSDNDLTIPKNLSDMKDLLYNNGSDVEAKLKSALEDQDFIDVGLDYLALSDVELVQKSQLDGLKRCMNVFSFKEPSPLKDKLNSLLVSLMSGKQMKMSDIDSLKILADKENFILEKDGDLFILSQQSKNGYVEKSINLCVDPTLSLNKQAEISKSFMAIPNVFEAAPRSLFNEARSRIDDAVEVLKNDSTATIVWKGGYAYLCTAAESTVLAPAKLFTSMFKEFTSDKDFNATKVLATYGSGLVPVVIFNYGKNVFSNKGFSRLMSRSVIVDSLKYPYDAVKSVLHHSRLDIWPAVKNGDYRELFKHSRNAVKAKALDKFFFLRSKRPFRNIEIRDLYDSISKKNNILAELYEAKGAITAGEKNRIIENINKRFIDIKIKGLRTVNNISDISSYIKLVEDSLDVDLLINKHQSKLLKNGKFDKKLIDSLRNGDVAKIKDYLEKEGIVSSKSAARHVEFDPKIGRKTVEVDLGGKNGKRLMAQFDTKLSPGKLENAEKELSEELLKNSKVDKSLLSKIGFKNPKTLHLFEGLKKIGGPSFAAWIVYQSFTSKTPQRDVAQDIVMMAGGYSAMKLLSAKGGIPLSKKRAILGVLVLAGTILDTFGFPYGTNFVNARLDEFGNFVLGGDKVPLNEFYGGVLNLTTSSGFLISRMRKLIVERAVKKAAKEATEEAVEKGVVTSVEKGLFKKLGEKISKKVAEKLASVAGKGVLKSISEKFAGAGAALAIPVPGVNVLISAGMALWTAYDAYDIYDIYSRGTHINDVIGKRSGKNIKKFEFLKGHDEVDRALRSNMLKSGANPQKIKEMSFDELVETASSIKQGNKTLLETVYESLQDVEVRIIRDGDGSGDYDQYRFNGGKIIGVEVSEKGKITKMGGDEFDAKIELPPNLDFRPEKFEKNIDYSKPESEVTSAISVFIQIAQSETHWDKMRYKVNTSGEIEFSRKDNGRTRKITRKGGAWYVDGLSRDFTLFQAMTVANLINYLPNLDDVGNHDAGSKRPFENDDGALDFDVNWNPNDLEVLSSGGNSAKFYKKVGLEMGLVADLMNDAYVKNLI